MLSCKEIARLTASDELAGARLRLRLAVRFHRMLCRACRRYASQIRSLGVWARKCAEAGPQEADSLAKLRRSILARGPEGPGRSTPGDDPAGRIE